MLEVDVLAPAQLDVHHRHKLALDARGDVTSALYRGLVVQKKIATEVGASYDGYARDSGEFFVYAIPKPGVKLETVERAINGVIDAFATKQTSPADLARAKTQLVANATYRRDSQYELASAYGQALVIGLTVDDVEQWPDRIRAVTANDVRQAAKDSLLSKESVTGYLLPGGQ